MATLLMIESWLHSTGQSLPPLLRSLGHEYVLVTRDPRIYGAGTATPHPALSRADDVVVVETNDVDATVARCAAAAATRTIDGVLTTCDYYLATAAAVANALGLPGSSAAAMRRATQKHEVRAATDAAGLPAVRHAVVSSLPRALEAAGRSGYPVVVKPVDLNAGTAVRRADEEAHVKDAWREITAATHNTRGQELARLLLVEELLTGTEVSVESVTVDGVTTVVGVTDKSLCGPPAFVESGHMFPASLSADDLGAVERLVVDALAAVGLTHGLSHTEVMLTPAGPRLVEINPRQGGGYIFDLIDLVAGVHPLRLLVDLALGEPPTLGTAASPARGAVAPGGSAAVMFVMSPVEGTVVAVDGIEAVAADPHVHRCVLPVPADAVRPADNQAYLGHVVVVDPDGPHARRHAHRLVTGLRLRLADGRVVAPLDPHGASAA